MTSRETEDTIFHKIIRRELPADIVYEDDQLIVIQDKFPAANLHLLLIPKKSISNLGAVEECDKALLGHMLFTAAQIAKQRGIADQGYRVVLNIGELGGEVVHQMHMHLLGGRQMGWPPG